MEDAVDTAARVTLQTRSTSGASSVVASECVQSDADVTAPIIDLEAKHDKTLASRTHTCKAFDVNGVKIPAEFTPLCIHIDLEDLKFCDVNVTDTGMFDLSSSASSPGSSHGKDILNNACLAADIAVAGAKSVERIISEEIFTTQ